MAILDHSICSLICNLFLKVQIKKGSQFMLSGKVGPNNGKIHNFILMGLACLLYCIWYTMQDELHTKVNDFFNCILSNYNCNFVIAL